MAKNNRQQEKWILTTSVALSVLAALYFFLLFPRETSTVFLQYLTYIIVSLILVLAVTLTVMIFKKQQKRTFRTNTEETGKKEKTVEQLIWRNRYVLQSQKAQLMFEDNSESREQWHQAKVDFARKYISPVIPEDDVPLEVTSELIEKSLRGASIGGIRPPTYNVKDLG